MRDVVESVSIVGGNGSEAIAWEIGGEDVEALCEEEGDEEGEVGGGTREAVEEEDGGWWSGMIMMGT